MEPERVEVEREAAVIRSGALAMSHNPALAAIVAATAAGYGALFSGLSIIFGGRQILLTGKGGDLVDTPREASFCATAIQRPGEPLVVPDAREDARFSKLVSVTKAPFIRFYAGAPVMDQNGYALGALCIADQQPRLEALDPTRLMMQAREVEKLLSR